MAPAFFNVIIDVAVVGNELADSKPLYLLASTLRAVPDICERQKRVYDVYHKYLAGPEQWIRAVNEIDRVRGGHNLTVMGG